MELLEVCKRLETDDCELAGIIRKWIPLIRGIAYKLQRTDPDYDYEDYIQNSLVQVIDSVKFYRQQEAVISVCQFIGFSTDRKLLDMSSFIGMKLRNFFVNEIRARFTQKRGITKQYKDGKFEVTDSIQRTPFYFETKDGDDQSILDFTPSIDDNPESYLIQKELLYMFFDELTEKESKLVGFLLSNDKDYLVLVKQQYDDKLEQKKRGSKYVNLSKGMQFTLSSIAKYMGTNTMEAGEMIKNCRNKFYLVVGV